MLIVQLTPEQIEAIAPAMERIASMAQEGKPGMCVAQVYGDHMRVGVFSHEAATSIAFALGTPARAHRTAYDLLPQDGGPTCNVLRPWE